MFPISAIIRLTHLLEWINALERLRKRVSGSEEVPYWEREDSEEVRKVRERVVTGVVVVVAKCGSNSNGIFQQQCTFEASVGWEGKG